VITQAVFRLHPIPHHTRTLSVAVDGPGAAQSLMLRIQDSQLAHSALQFRSDAGAVDVLLEGPEAGIAAQQSALSNMAPFAEGPASVWGARQDLWPAGDAAIAKFSVLPSRIHETLTQLRPERAVVQATGLGYARLTGDLAVARQKVEANGGSLVVLTPTHLDVWGQQGNALPLMRALKQQFDPNSILNRGRFVGGI
jgi:glycolate oxidase FAD binding subunit